MPIDSRLEGCAVLVGRAAGSQKWRVDQFDMNARVLDGRDSVRDLQQLLNRGLRIREGAMFTKFHSDGSSAVPPEKKSNARILVVYNED